MQLTGHKALVTGGSAGIGLAIAQMLIDGGNRVTICGRDPERLEEAGRLLGAVDTLRFDLANTESVAKLVRDAADRMDGLTMLVNNAAVQRSYRFADTDPAAIVDRARTEVDINFSSIVALTAASLPLLRTARESAVVNLSSSLALSPKASAPVYCATKAAVHSFSRSLRYQLAEDLPHVRVFEVMPPLVETAMSAGRGRRKMAPGAVAAAVRHGLENDRFEILVGPVRAMRMAQRVAPRLVARLLQNS